MKIQYASDLHLEFPDNSRFLAIVEIRPNVKCYYNAVVTIENIDFILCTLWSHIPNENAFITQQNVSDFYRIAYKGKLMTAPTFNQAHKDAVAFLKKTIVEGDKAGNNRKRIVVSHHVPTALCMADEFKNSRINGAFVAELQDFIYDNRIDFWIYGHSHRNMPEININGTKMLCNQLGYVQSGEHKKFNRQAFFEIRNEKCCNTQSY